MNKLQEITLIKKFPRISEKLWVDAKIIEIKNGHSFTDEEFEKFLKEHEY